MGPAQPDTRVDTRLRTPFSVDLIYLAVRRELGSGLIGGPYIERLQSSSYKSLR